MLKSQRAPLVSVTCSSDLLRRVQWRKNERHKAAVPLTNVPTELSHALSFSLSLSLQANFASAFCLISTIVFGVYVPTVRPGTC